MTSNDSIRWGILSTANIGRGRVIPAIHNSRNGEVTAVASRSSEKAQLFASQTNIPRAYGSYEELIDDPNVDAIYVALPNSLHKQWSILCAEAGKPTLCEKPLASSGPEAQEMVDAFAQKGVLFAEAFMYRFHPQTQKVKQLVVDGTIGELRLIQSAFSFPLQSDDNIRLDKSLAGGSLMDVGCYSVNLMRYLTEQEPTHVSAVGHWGEQSRVDETLTGLLQFPSGVLGHFDCSLRLPWSHGYEIRGTHGRIVVEQGFVMNPESDAVIRSWHEDEYEEITIKAADHYQLMVEDFAEALLNQRQPRFLPQDGVNNMVVIDRLYDAVQRRI